MILNRFHKSDENGSMVVWMAVLCAICMIIAISLGKVGNATSGVALAQNAADSAALSAAYEIAHFKSELACSSARFAASSNEAKLTSCKTSQDYVEIEVQLEDGSDIKAKARAELK